MPPSRRPGADLGQASHYVYCAFPMIPSPRRYLKVWTPALASRYRNRRDPQVLGASAACCATTREPAGTLDDRLRCAYCGRETIKAPVRSRAALDGLGSSAHRIDSTRYSAVPGQAVDVLRRNYIVYTPM